jgi:S1-C subfamily serine protease
MMSLFRYLLVGLIILFPDNAGSLESSIEMMQSIIPSIVIIHVESGGLFKTPGSAFRDAKTGKILIARKLKAVKHARDGSGVIIDEDGIIVTNAHTVSNASRITITLHNGTHLQAAVLDVIPEEDLAFLKIDTDIPLEALALANSDNITLRSRVFTVGSSDVLNGTISEGTITGIGKSASGGHKNTHYINLIQTDFSVYKGDSGGPLINTSGELLGVVLAAKTRVSHGSDARP